MSLLRAGLHVVRRDDRHLQVGLDPPWRLVVPDEPDVRRVLDDLRVGVLPTPETLTGHRALRDLAEAGMLEPTRRSRPGRAAGSTREPAPVVVRGRGRAATRLVELLEADGTRTTVGTGQDTAVLVVVVADGEPHRDWVDEQVREGRPHLVLGAGAHGYRLGPLVVPGTTACLRCLDAHLGEHDPRRAVVVEQLSGRDAGPGDPALEALALAWAVRDISRYLRGEQPSTWSGTVELPVDGDPVRRAWTRHPYCGCSWGGAAIAPDRAVSAE